MLERATQNVKTLFFKTNTKQNFLVKLNINQGIYVNPLFQHTNSLQLKYLKFTRSICATLYDLFLFILFVTTCR